MGKKEGNNEGNATGYINEKGKRKTRAKKKDQTIFQLGPNVGLYMDMCKKTEIKVSQLHPISRKICPQCCHFIFKDFHANWPKTGSEGRNCLFWC